MPIEEREEAVRIGIGNWKNGVDFISWEPETRKDFARLFPNEKKFCFDLPPRMRPQFIAELAPLPSLAERKAELRKWEIRLVHEWASEEELLLIAREQNRSPLWAVETKLVVNGAELARAPHRPLLDYLAKKHVIAVHQPRRFPMIQFGAAEAIDANGVTRDFVSGVFDALCQDGQKRLPMRKVDGKYLPEIADPNHPGALNDEERDLLPPSAFGYLSLERQASCYQAIGMLLAFALSRHHTQQTVPIGVHFADVFYEMLHAVNVPVFHPQGELAKKAQILSVYLKVNHPDWFGPQHKISNEALQKEVRELLEGRISERLQALGFDVAMRDLLRGEYQGVLDAVYEIAKSMARHYPGTLSKVWPELKGADANALKERIEGVFSIDRVLEAFGYPVSSIEVVLDDPHQQNVRRWILEHKDSNPGIVKELVHAISGSTTLAPGTKLHAEFNSAIDANNWPKFETCFLKMKMPEYPSYEIFKERLEKCLKELDDARKAGNPFQGVL